MDARIEAGCNTTQQGRFAAQMSPLTSAEAQEPSAITACLNNDLL